MNCRANCTLESDGGLPWATSRPRATGLVAFSSSSCCWTTTGSCPCELYNNRLLCRVDRHDSTHDEPPKSGSDSRPVRYGCALRIGASTFLDTLATTFTLGS